MTKREVITAMLNDSAISANADYVAYLENEIKLLDKKAARAKTAPKKADAYIDAVANALTSDPQTRDDIAAVIGISPAKAGARLNKLVEDGKAVKGFVKVDKKKKVTYVLAQCNINCPLIKRAFF